MTADLRREEIARRLPMCDPPEPREQRRHYFEPGDIRCGCGDLTRPLTDVGEVTLFQPARSQDTATARIAELEGALGALMQSADDYEAQARSRRVWDEGDAVETIIRGIQQYRAVLSGETRTDGEPQHQLMTLASEHEPRTDLELADEFFAYLNNDEPHEREVLTNYGNLRVLPRILAAALRERGDPSPTTPAATEEPE